MCFRLENITWNYFLNLKIIDSLKLKIFFYLLYGKGTWTGMIPDQYAKMCVLKSTHMHNIPRCHILPMPLKFYVIRFFFSIYCKLKYIKAVLLRMCIMFMLDAMGTAVKMCSVIPVVFLTNTVHSCSHGGGNK